MQRIGRSRSAFNSMNTTAGKPSFLPPGYHLCVSLTLFFKQCFFVVVICFVCFYISVELSHFQMEHLTHILRSLKIMTNIRAHSHQESSLVGFLWFKPKYNDLFWFGAVPFQITIFTRVTAKYEVNNHGAPACCTRAHNDFCSNTFAGILVHHRLLIQF